ncbi:MAG TPA: aminotransferase class III-fold pyridoxal phosphate-dependent enzyme [Planctomycetota bacterium]|jgi:glutamate-1-semialdehyde 2,1-aminomutase
MKTSVSSAAVVPSSASATAVVNRVSQRESILAAQTALEQAFARRCPQSILLHHRAKQLFPGGVTHDNRHLAGPSLFIRSAKGPAKFCQDNHRYIDYWMGHGSLLLGHGRHEVIEAVHLAAQDITHPGACHEREVLWGEQVLSMFREAKRIRFTAAGSDATALAVRLARALTKKPVIVKFEGHFHGWMDHAVEGVDMPFDTPFSAGVPSANRALTVVLPARDLNKVEDVLIHRNDIAAIILEPTGASGGTVPIRPDFLRGLRELTNRHGVLLIFDEVITGFRVAPGGAQQKFNVTADLTCLAKVLAGGLPGGAVCGTRDAFDAMEFSGDPKQDRYRRVVQYGTFNANPISAAAGKVALGLVADGEASKRADSFTSQLKAGLNSLFRHENLPWAAYGFSSVFHILTSDPCAGQSLRDHQIEAADIDPPILKQKGPVDALLRRALQLEGVDLPPGRQAWVSCMHGTPELDETLLAFTRAIERLRGLGCV